MQKLALLASFVAVGLALWVATRTSNAPADRLDRMEADLDELRVLETRLANVERRVAEAGAPRPGPVDAPLSVRPAVVDGALAAFPARRRERRGRPRRPRRPRSRRGSRS